LLTSGPFGTFGASAAIPIRQTRSRKISPLAWSGPDVLTMFSPKLRRHVAWHTEPEPEQPRSTCAWLHTERCSGCSPYSTQSRDGWAPRSPISLSFRYPFNHACSSLLRVDGGWSMSHSMVRMSSPLAFVCPNFGDRERWGECLHRKLSAAIFLFFLCASTPRQSESYSMLSRSIGCWRSSGEHSRFSCGAIER
jgi:hypothetical protein